jgi:hypothetical protein
VVERQRAGKEDGLGAAICVPFYSAYSAYSGRTDRILMLSSAAGFQDRKKDVRSKRVLAIITYVLGAYVFVFGALFISTLSDVKELIEIHQWHGCSSYKDYPTYVDGGIFCFASLGVMFLASWGFLKTGYWKFAIIPLTVATTIMFLGFWWTRDCWP